MHQLKRLRSHRQTLKCPAAALPSPLKRTGKPVTAFLVYFSRLGFSAAGRFNAWRDKPKQQLCCLIFLKLLPMLDRLSSPFSGLVLPKAGSRVASAPGGMYPKYFCKEHHLVRCETFTELFRQPLIPCPLHFSAFLASWRFDKPISPLTDTNFCSIIKHLYFKNY
jgi:hypothetical protein